jgi:multidrug efflux pump subunit AcrA (membrane-fusion protein)
MTSELIINRQGEVLDLSEAEPSISRAIRWGALVILIAFGGSLGWGFLATLDSAAHATGVIVVEGNRKTVQHLEGGIVSELKVRDGDVVQPGQVLLRLDATKTQATLEELMVKYWDTLVRVARLRMEQIGQRTFSAPSELASDNADPAVKRAINVQHRLFMARWIDHDTEIEVLREQSRQAEREIQAHNEDARRHRADRLRAGGTGGRPGTLLQGAGAQAAPDVGQTLYLDSMRSRKNRLPEGGGRILLGAMIGGGFLTAEER